MSKVVSQLVIDVTTQHDAAAKGLDQVGESSVRMSRQVEQAGASAERSARSFTVSADAADDLGGKAGKATGALGALSSGFELVGAEKYAGALQGAALATDFFSGVGDSLNLVMESTIVRTTIARARSVQLAVTQRVAAVATRGMAAAQWVLNAALRANPIGIVITLLVAIAAAVVIAYRRSETFRNIVQAAGRIAVSAFRGVVNVTQDVIAWVKRIPAGFESVKDKASKIGSALTAPFRALYDWVQKVIGALGRIRIPKIPGIGKIAGALSFSSARAPQPLARGIMGLSAPAAPLTVGGFSSGSMAVSSGSSGGSGVTIDARTYVTVDGALDEVAVARKLDGLLTRHRRMLGTLAAVTP